MRGVRRVKGYVELFRKLIRLGGATRLLLCQLANVFSSGTIVNLLQKNVSPHCFGLKYITDWQKT